MSRHATRDLEYLASKDEIRDLAFSYCRGVDRRDYELVRELYHEDAIDDHGEAFCGPRDAFIAWIPHSLSQFEATQHCIQNTLIEIDGDRAEGEIYVVAYHRTHAPAAREIVGGARYLDRYERRVGAWRFLRRKVVLDWMTDQPLIRSGASPREVAGLSLGCAGSNDASYAHLSMFGRLVATAPSSG